MWRLLTISMADWQSPPSKKAQTSEVVEIYNLKPEGGLKLSLGLFFAL